MWGPPVISWFHALAVILLQLNHKNRNQHDNMRAAIGFTLPLQHRRTSMSACCLAETQGSWEDWWPPLSFRFMRWFLRDGSSRVPQRFLFKTQSSENCTTKTRQKLQKEDELSRACWGGELYSTLSLVCKIHFQSVKRIPSGNLT